jgi:ATP-dependent RNA helicase DDX27
MDPDFRFDPDGSDDEAAATAYARGKPAQSPWEFATYAQSVAAEHASRRTTSIDEKISQALRGRINPSMPDGSEDEGEEEEADDDDDTDDEAVKGESGDEEDELEESDDEEESEGEEVDEEDSGEEAGKLNGHEQGEEEGEEEEAAHEVSFAAI